jgi:hypothetical protein
MHGNSHHPPAGHASAAALDCLCPTDSAHEGKQLACGEGWLMQRSNCLRRMPWPTAVAVDPETLQ